MSDQYTRVTCGGSPLDKDSSVVGLLFGLMTKSADAAAAPTLDIRDADDIPTVITEQSQNQVGLHQAVFPMHSVVGWYRVSEDPNPTAIDLALTRQLQEHYCSANQHPFVFALLQVPEAISTAAGESSAPEDSKSTGMLPLMLYQLSEDGSILLAHNFWSLQTSNAERIGIERVVQERPQKNDDDSSSYCTHLDSLQQSLQAMQDRLEILVDFLQQVQNGSIADPPLSLLRRVRTLVCQLGPLVAMSSTANPDQDNTATILSHLAAVSKTVGAVSAYTDKINKVSESSLTSTGAAAASIRRATGRTWR
jgi:COP9 signalosome complex subunit 6